MKKVIYAAVANSFKIMEESLVTYCKVIKDQSVDYKNALSNYMCCHAKKPIIAQYNTC
jgi:hypothetical protein